MTGLTSITFRGLSVEEIVRLASEAGLSGIEWGSDVHVPPGHVQAAENAAALTAAHGLKVTSYGSYLKVGEQPETEKVMDQLLLSAAALKAPVIRLWAGTKAPENTTAAERKQIEYELNRLVGQADKKGVRLATEYHRGTLTQNAESAAALMEAVPGLYTYWQPNPDVSEQTNRDELAHMLPWLLNVHVFQWTAPGNQRHPLAEGTAIWTEYIRKASAEKSRDHHFLLEFVKDDSREQCLADASVLNRIVKESEKYL